jgi:hypothetical protein
MEEEEGFQTPNDRAAPERAIQALVTQDELPPPTKM